MIRITQGTFGYYNGRKIIPLTSADGPQCLDPELEARLVKEGVAEYAEETEAPATPDTVPDAPSSLPEYDEGMKLEELKSIAAEYGVDASSLRKKADIIRAIEAAKAEEPDDQDSTEQPPQLDAAEPV